ncbi:MAG: hypothetical protein JO232_13280 [Verrucomicrobia bacterium]|nr:hypothetical protein [Verrucomicrobiota bacterium]
MRGLKGDRAPYPNTPLLQHSARQKFEDEDDDEYEYDNTGEDNRTTCIGQLQNLAN